MKKQKTSPGFWKIKENRIKKIRQMVEGLDKSLGDISKQDFIDAGLSGLLTGYYSNTLYLALQEAGYKVQPEEMKRIPSSFLKSKENRIHLINNLLHRLKKDPRELERKDFEKFKLGGLLQHYYSGSPYKAVIEAGYDLKPWEMAKAPNSTWRNRDARIEAIRWLVKKTGKEPNEISKENFLKNGLGGLLAGYYDDYFHALKEAGYPVHQLDFAKTTSGYWKKKKNRIEAIKKMVNKLGVDPSNITQKDFQMNKLGGLLGNYYNNSHYAALIEAGYDLKPWEMAKAPNSTWRNRDARIEAIRWLVEEKLKKLPKGITQKDFTDHLGGILKYYSGHYFKALLDAGYEIDPREKEKIPGNFWKKKENRISETKKMVKELDKHPTEITQDDFIKTGRKTILNYNNDSPFEALKEAKLVSHPSEMKIKPQGYWNNRENRIYEIRKMVKNSDVSYNEITQLDFIISGCLGALRHCKSIQEAMSEAGYTLTEEDLKRGIYGTSALRYKSNHGDMFRSSAERSLDNLFYHYKIDHEHNVKYPGSINYKNRKFNCDFVVGGGRYWIEYAGLLDSNLPRNGMTYRETIKIKKEIARENGLDLIIIYPQDLSSNKVFKKIEPIIKEFG